MKIIITLDNYQYGILISTHPYKMRKYNIRKYNILTKLHSENQSHAVLSSEVHQSYHNK